MWKAVKLFGNLPELWRWKARVKLVALIKRNRIEGCLMLKMILKTCHGTMTPAGPPVWR